MQQQYSHNAVTLQQGSKAAAMKQQCISSAALQPQGSNNAATTQQQGSNSAKQQRCSSNAALTMRQSSKEAAVKTVMQQQWYSQAATMQQHFCGMVQQVLLYMSCFLTVS